MKEYLKDLYSYFIISRSGLYDREYYLKTYPDVLKSDVDPLWHYIRYGWKENRNPSDLFDTRDYLTLYPDVMKSGINPLLHYYRFGKGEGRIPKIINKSESNDNKVGVVIVSFNASMAVKSNFSKYPEFNK